MAEAESGPSRRRAKDKKRSDGHEARVHVQYAKLQKKKLRDKTDNFAIVFGPNVVSRGRWGPQKCLVRLTR